MVYRYPGAACNALDDVQVGVRRGSFTAVIGLNGSGKSTLARHMNGLLVPGAGAVVVDGLNTGDPRNIPEIRRRVGFVFQNPDNQLVGATVEEDIAFGPENLGLSPASIREAVDYALEVTGLAGLAQRPTQALSGGQKQLLAIAGSLAMRTRCLVLDEATAMIGPAGRRRILDLIKKLVNQFSMTLVLITHFMEEAVLADRVLVMHRGRIIMEGTPAQVFRSGSLLTGTGLALPGPADLACRLRSYGLNLPDPVLSLDELVDSICRL